MPLMHNRFEGRAMEIVPIKTNRDYRRTLKEIEGLMTAKRNTPEGDRLDVLVTLIESWEARNHPLDLPDPIRRELWSKVGYESLRGGVS